LLLFGSIKIPEEDEDSEEEGKGRRSTKKNAPSYDNNQYVLHTEIIDRKDPETEREFKLLDMPKPEYKDDNNID